MNLAEPPTAVIATTDYLATGALHAAYTMGVEVPNQVSVVGFDDLPLAAYAVPPLTTVKMPIREMTRAAVTLAIGEEAENHQNMLVTPSLVIRASSGPVA